MLGEGIVPFPQVVDWLRRNAQYLWIIAEQDRAVTPPAEAAWQNPAYLRALFCGESQESGR